MDGFIYSQNDRAIHSEMTHLIFILSFFVLYLPDHCLFVVV